MAEGIQGPERRIVLVGKTGNGKSATGNTLLGSRIFKCGVTSKSITKKCQKEETWWNGRKVTVVDTPGFFDSQVDLKKTAAEVRKCVSFCSPGPHVIVQVMRPGRFSKEEMEVAQLIADIFSLETKRYMVVLFIRSDDMEGTTLEEYLAGDEVLKAQLAECGNRYLSFNNKAEGGEREAEVANLMRMIDELVERNQDAPCYTEEKLRKDEEELKKKKSWCFLF